VAPAIKAVERVILGAYGVMLTPSDWLEAYEIEYLVSTVQRVLYASRTDGTGLPVGLCRLVGRHMETLRSVSNVSNGNKKKYDHKQAIPPSCGPRRSSCHYFINQIF
ncbi:Hypothetical protein FKW44_011611, partial [Caligus rogercresseyi]